MKTLAFALVALVMACSSSGREAPASPKLAIDPASLTTFHFHATGSGEKYTADGGVTLFPPPDVTVTDPSVVKALYSYLAARPFTPPCEDCHYHCVLSPEITYYLQFSGPGGSATFDLSFSCGADYFLTIEGTPELVSSAASEGQDQFFATLAQAIGTDPSTLPYAK